MFVSKIYGVVVLVTSTDVVVAVVGVSVIVVVVVSKVVVPLSIDEAEVAIHVEAMVSFNFTMYPSTVSLASSKKSFNDVR